jgi:hypothetical protein
MNCVELQQSLAEVEDGSTLEQSSHLRTCAECASLLEDLNQIVAVAGELQMADDPSPRVWNSIEIALRQEGLIRPQPSPRPSNSAPGLPAFVARWGAARWLVPAAALLLITVGFYERRSNLPVQQASVLSAPVRQSDSTAGLNDEDLMQEVADNPPALRSDYEENLKRVNESIQDAEGAVKENPNDQDARRSLMDAYQQKSMLFEMAMERSQP